MVITFNAQNVGYGNNGGTATLFHSANVLHQLGHRVNVISDSENQFSWFKLNGPKFIKAYGTDYPDADIHVATGAGSVKHVFKAPVSKGVKFWWIRGHESWIAKDDSLFSMYRNPEIRNMVNSECLRKFIEKKTGMASTVVRPGLDFDVFRSTRKRNWRKRKFTIGALYTERASKRFKWLPYICDSLKNKGVACRLRLFGSWEDPIALDYHEYLREPSPARLNEFYNDVDFWIAPTKTEGLHIPPQEAMLCGCVVIGAAGELNGMNDYLKDGVTGYLVNHPDQAVELLVRFISDKWFVRNVEFVSRAGAQKIRSLGDRRHNMGLMAEHFRKAIKGEM